MEAIVAQCLEGVPHSEDTLTETMPLLKYIDD